MSAGGSSGEGSSEFRRTGTVDTSSWRDLTGDHQDLFGKAFGNVDDSLIRGYVQPMLGDRMTRKMSDVPYNDVVQNVAQNNVPGNKFGGQDSLTKQAGIDPYSKSYEDATFDRYTDEVLRAISQSRSGPSASRGGTAAQGFMMSDAVNQLGLNREDVLAKNRQADASIQQGASGLLGQQQGRMDQTALSAAGAGMGSFFNLMQDQQAAGSLSSERSKLYADLVPTYTALTTKMLGNEKNNLSGKGAQTSSSVGGGFNLCCFIFLEAYDGVLPESVRKYRDMVAPESSFRRVGYVRMSKWLVPAMRVSEGARKLTSCLLTEPLKAYGEWYYGKNKWGWVFWPVKQVWFKVWEQLGK